MELNGFINTTGEIARRINGMTDEGAGSALGHDVTSNRSRAIFELKKILYSQIEVSFIDFLLAQIINQTDQ